MNDRKPDRPSAMDHPATTENKPKKSARLSREIQVKIGQQLRAMYDEVVSEGVPDRFSDLLKKLEERGDEDKR